MNAVKKNRFGKPSHETSTIAVLGAGLMGAGIAQVSVEKGLKVLLKDQTSEFVAKGERTITDNLKKKVKKKRMSQFKQNICEANVIPLADSDAIWTTHFKGADMIIEAVPENLELKHRVIQQME